MSIATARTAIQAFNRALSGVKYAPDIIPNKITDDELPCVLAFIGPGEWQHETFGDWGESARRTWDIRVYVKAVGQGEEGEAYAAAETLLQTIGHAYLHDREIDDSIFHDWEITDSGIRGDMLYAGQAYVGFVITLRPMTWE